MKRLLLLLLVGCGSGAPVPTQPGAPEPRLLSETQALLAMREALREAGAIAESAAVLTLEGAPLQADVRFGEPTFAIEWAGTDDRAHRDLPAATPDSPLRIVSATDGKRAIQVLVLDERAYGYEGNSLLVQRGAPSLDDAERRVRRDVTDFVEYARDQGAQL
ncbi:MAG TPA: hypothetical protein VFX59_21985 [Polyangiales bacterium]|nr:hypothetical protein [Polyangiales bacterium]